MRRAIYFVVVENDKSWGRPSEKKHYEFFRGPEEGSTLGDFLRDKVSNGAWLVGFGAVYVNAQRVTDSSLIVSATDVVRVHTRPKRYPILSYNLKDRLVLENEDYAIIDKPSGLPMHATLDNLYENLVSGYGSPLFVTHRLDVPTSGLVLVAKTKEYQILFNELIYRREVKKIYEALIQTERASSLRCGELIHYMKKTVSAPKLLVKDLPSDTTPWQECRLRIDSIDGNKLEIELLTGRTHQIRAQLSFEGAPILGDEMYGGVAAPQFGLRSSALSFRCPKEKKQKLFTVL